MRSDPEKLRLLRDYVESVMDDEPDIATVMVPPSVMVDLLDDYDELVAVSDAAREMDAAWDRWMTDDDADEMPTAAIAGIRSALAKAGLA